MIQKKIYSVAQSYSYFNEHNVSGFIKTHRDIIHGMNELQYLDY